MSKIPKSGQVYTLAEIFKLELRDSPFLRFAHRGKICVIQDGSLGREELLAVPGMVDSLWRYEYETAEWCPLFMYVGTAPITDLVDIEPWFNRASNRLEDGFWVTPKGHRSEQYGLREAIQTGEFTPLEGVTFWLDPDWDKKHCTRCKYRLEPRGSEPTPYNRESIDLKGDGVCAMCHAKSGDVDAIELQAGSAFANNPFSRGIG